MKHRKQNHTGFSLIEVLVALFILAFIATMVSQIQFTSLFRLALHHERLKVALRMKKELVKNALLHLKESKLETIDDENKGLKIHFFTSKLGEKSSLVEISKSLKKITAQASWEVLNQKEEMNAAIICYDPEQDDEEKKA